MKKDSAVIPDVLLSNPKTFVFSAFTKHFTCKLLTAVNLHDHVLHVLPGKCWDHCEQRRQSAFGW